MGWGRYLLLGDLGQQMDLADHEAEIGRLKEQLRSKQAVPSSVEQRLETLQRENDELKLYLAAVIRLMVAKKLATTDEITALVAAVDREDGLEDKKYTGAMLPGA
jgi:siderophore synthetase component